MAEDLLKISRQLKLKDIIVIGVGVGANIALRLASLSPTLVLGIIAFQPVVASAGIMEQVKERSVACNLNLNHSRDTDNFLILHKFGQLGDSSKEDLRRCLVETFKSTLHSDMNPRNLQLYVEAYMKRSDITEEVKKNVKCDILFLVGSCHGAVKQTETLYKSLTKTGKRTCRASLIKIEGVGDALEECPNKVAESILLFAQGLGMVPTVRGPRQRYRSDRPRGLSMSSADVPNLGRLSLSE